MLCLLWGILENNPSQYLARRVGQGKTVEQHETGGPGHGTFGPIALIDKRVTVIHGRVAVRLGVCPLEDFLPPQLLLRTGGRPWRGH